MSRVVQRCECGSAYTLKTWNGLVFVGYMDVRAEHLELRKCVCGSSVSVDVTQPEPVAPAEASSRAS